MNGNFDDDEAIQNEKERNKSGILQGVDHFSSTQERGIYGEKEKTPRGLNGIQDDKINKKDQADIDAINNRGKNQSTDINGKKKKNKDGDDNESSGSSSSGKKDELESKDDSKDKDSKDKEKDKNKDKEKGYNFDIEVDGGVNDKTVVDCYKAGATVAVAGSYVFNAEDPSISKL